MVSKDKDTNKETDMKRGFWIAGAAAVLAAAGFFVARSASASDHILTVSWDYDGDAVDPYHLQVDAGLCEPSDAKVHLTVTDCSTGNRVFGAWGEVQDGFDLEDVQSAEVALTEFPSGSNFTVRADFLDALGNINVTKTASFTKP